MVSKLTDVSNVWGTFQNPESWDSRGFPDSGPIRIIPTDDLPNPEGTGFSLARGFEIASYANLTESMLEEQRKKYCGSDGLSLEVLCYPPKSMLESHPDVEKIEVSGQKAYQASRIEGFGSMWIKTYLESPSSERKYKIEIKYPPGDPSTFVETAKQVIDSIRIW